MANLIRKTYNLPAPTVAQIDEIVAQAERQGMELNPSVVVRAALRLGLPLAAKNWNLTQETENDQREIEAV